MHAKTQRIETAPEAADARWDDVRVFLAAHRHKTLGAAARQLGLDTSTVSRRLAVFEDVLGARLFDRSRDGLVITRAGQLLLPAAEAMEAAHGRLARDASNIESTAEGIVRLTVAPGMADHFIAPLVGRLRARHPGIRLQLDASIRVVDLQRYESDLALRSVKPAGAELLVTKLGSARWVPAGAPALVERLGALSSWSDAPWIAWDQDMERFHAAQWLRAHAPGAPVTLTTSLFTSQLIAAKTAAALVLAPEPYLGTTGLVPARASRKLSASLDALPIDDLWLVCHRALRDVPRVAAVWDFLAEEFRRALAAPGFSPPRARREARARARRTAR